MSRAFLVPILLPADPTAPLEASTKQYVDNAVGFTFTQDATPTATSPGQTWFNTATGASYVWIDDGTSTQWVQFAPGAGGGSGKQRGVVAYSQVTTSMTIATTAFTELGMNVTWTADPTRTYRTTVFFLASSTVNNDDLSADIVDGSGNRKQLFPSPYLDPNTSITMYASLVETGLSGTQTRKARANRAGTGTMTIAGDPTYPRYIMVEDITLEVGGGGAGVGRMIGGLASRGLSSGWPASSYTAITWALWENLYGIVAGSGTTAFTLTPGVWTVSVRAQISVPLATLIRVTLGGISTWYNQGNDVFANVDFMVTVVANAGMTVDLYAPGASNLLSAYCDVRKVSEL